MTNPDWLETLNGRAPVYAADYAACRYFAHGAEMDGAGSFFDAVQFTFDRPSIATLNDGSLKIVGYGVPRIGSAGILLEGAATNLAKCSNDPTNAVWSKSKCSASLGAITGPDGKPSGFSLQEDSTSGFHELYQSVAITAGAPYAVSGFLKAGSRSGRAWATKGLENFFANPDLAAGTVGPAATTGTGISVPIAAFIESYGNGWSRNGASGKFTTLTSMFIDMDVRNLAAANPDNYLGDGVSQVYGFGLQAEAGNFPTSYIPSGTSGGTRARDSLTRKFLSNVQAVTKRIKFVTAPGKPTDYQVLYHLDNNQPTSGGLYCDAEVFRDSSGHLFVTVTYNLATTNIDFGPYPDATEGTIAFTASPAGIIASLNGGSAQSAALLNPWPINLSYERLGHNMDAARNWFGSVKEDYTFLATATADQVVALAS